MRSSEFAETYDADKYAEMTLDIAESILGVFGFSRTQGFKQTEKLPRGAAWRERKGDPPRA